MTQNTMSFDQGDVDNDGSAELFATDMMPYSETEETLAAWQPLMGMMSHPSSADDPQTIRNVLQVRNSDNQFVEEAQMRAVAATGWSWSSKFGDLNNDGFLDIYSVNGMIAEGMLSHLPNDELVEENQALRNLGNGVFAPAPEWGLNSSASGRGMSMADLDQDGDLDVVVNNLRSPAQLFENQLCAGAGFEVDLRWPESKNAYAVGSRLTLHTTTGTYHRDVRAASGYLSGDPARVHFGLPIDSKIDRLEVLWPDGALTTVDALSSQTLVQIHRSDS
jgi:hypothetical protein